MKHIKSALLVSVAAGLGVLGATSASADQITLKRGAAYSGNGGEFAVTDYLNKNNSGTFAADTGANYYSGAQVKDKNGNVIGFDTFCIEYNEHFTLGGHYDFATSPNAIHGGNQVDDPVSVGTAYLYSLFAQGTLTGYDYSASKTSASAGNLQNTLWYLENEKKGTSLIADPHTYDALLTAKFGSSDPTVWMANNLTINGQYLDALYFGVQALNVGTGPVYPQQDQLVWTPSGHQSVPDGGTTLMLLGMALGGMSLLRRKLA